MRNLKVADLALLIGDELSPQRFCAKAVVDKIVVNKDGFARTGHYSLPG